MFSLDHSLVRRRMRALLARIGNLPEVPRRESIEGCIDDTESKCTRAYAPALGGKMMVVELDPGSGEYSAGIDLSGLYFRFGAFTAPAKFPSIEAAKSAAQADYEARVSSSLVETVGVEALVSRLVEAVETLIDAAGTAETTLAHALMDGMIDPNVEDRFEAWLQELIAAAHNGRAALAAMDTPKGGGDA